MTKAGFGEHLKREREMREVSLDEICAATRIATRFLEALENEQWERLPGGVFNRGFVRAVARFLGLDEEDLLAEYTLATSDQTSSAPAWTGQHPAHQQVTKFPVEGKWNRLPLLGLALLVLLLAGAGWFGWHRYSIHRAQRAAAQAAALRRAASSASAMLPAASTSDATAEPASAPDSSAASGAAANSTNPQSGAVTTAPPPAAPPTAIDGLQLKIEAGKPTSVTVGADGKQIFKGNIIAGQSRTFNAHKKFTVKAQDAGALLLELNGQTLAPMGPPGHSGKVTLTLGDLKPAGGAH